MASRADAAEALDAPGRERIMRGYLEAWNAGDASAVTAFFAPDAVYDDRGAAELCHGREQIREHVARVQEAFPDLRFELHRAAHADGFTVGEWSARMTHSGLFSGLWPTGRRVESAGVDVATMDDEDLIAHMVSYYDGAAIMRALGVLPEHGSLMERALVGFASAPRRTSSWGRRLVGRR